MSRLFYHVMQDNAGNLLFDVSGTMRLAGTGTAATIYGDEGLTIPIANPMTNHPSFGSFKCFLGAGDYDFYMAKSGYSFETLTGVQGHGTMAQQDANAVAITGGNIGGTVVLDTTGYGRVDRIGVGVSPSGLASGFTQLTGAVGIQRAPEATVGLRLNYNKITQFGMAVQQVGGDTGQATVVFLNLAGTLVGSIDATGSATAYNTTSDARLKQTITPLTGALDVVRALNPVAFRWKADGSPGRGFLANEVQEVIPDGVITGDVGAVDEQGAIIPQQMDYSKLVPWLVSAVKELTQQVEMLQAQLAAVVA